MTFFHWSASGKRENEARGRGYQIISFVSGWLNRKHIQDEWVWVAAGGRRVWIRKNDFGGCGNSQGDR